MRSANLRQRWITYDQVVIAAEGGICHHRHSVLRAPRQKVALNAPISETVGDLISRTALTVRNAEQILHLAPVEVGYPPSTNLSRRAELFECRHNTGEFPGRHRMMQQIEIQMVSAETREACVTSTGDAVSGHVTGLHLGDQEDTIPLTGHHMTQELLGAATSVISRRIDQRHAERKACSHGFFLDRYGPSPLSQVPGALTDRGDSSSIWKFYGPPRGLGCRVCGCENPRAFLYSKQCTEGRCRTTSTELTSTQQILAHGHLNFRSADCMPMAFIG
jgi:hypothetical protein